MGKSANPCPFPERVRVVGGVPPSRIDLDLVLAFAIDRPTTAEESTGARGWEIGSDEPFSFRTVTPQGCSASMIEPPVLPSPKPSLPPRRCGPSRVRSRCRP
jgi:hypothetical protein